jgi:hypothetical protein
MLAFCFFVYRYSHKRHDKKDLEWIIKQNTWK